MSSFVLKLVALTTMIIDHIGAVFGGAAAICTRCRDN